MPSNPNNTTPVLTPGGNLVPSQQTNPPGAVPYIENGLVYQSNNPDFVERDDNGNIIVNQGATDNQNLVLEATSLRYVNSSVIRNIDTRFKYFRFPAENVAVPEISFEGFGIDDLVDLVYAKYRPSEDWTLRETTLYSGVLMDTVLAGQPQLNTNAYTITPEIKELAVDGLRMRIRLAHRYTSYGIDLANSRWDPNFGTVKASYSNLSDFIRNSVITESDWNSILFSGGNGLIYYNRFVFDNRGDLDAAEDALVDYLTDQLNITQADAELYASNARTKYTSIFVNQSSIGTVYFSLIKREFETGIVIRDFRELTVDAGQQTAFIDANTTKISEYDIIIPNEDFQDGDQFNIGALVGQFVDIPYTENQSGRVSIHTLLQSPTQWSITDASQNVDENNNEID